MRKWLCLLLILLFPAAALTENSGSPLEIFFINVGKGDAILVRYRGYTCLIDTGSSGQKEAFRKGLEELPENRLDAVFLTHTDKDHVGGLSVLWKDQWSVENVYASSYYPEMDAKKHPAQKAADKLNCRCTYLFAGDTVPLGTTGAAFSVLEPEEELEGEDNNSLVMMLDSPEGRVLFTGDMKYREEGHLLSGNPDLRCDLLKVPNHGSDSACSLELIRACGAQAAVISTSSAEKKDTPDTYLLKMFAEYGTPVWVTQDSHTGIRAVLRNGNIEVTVS